MALTLIQGPTQEPIALDIAKLYLRIDQDNEDYLIESMIKAARQAIEAFTAKTLMYSTWRMIINPGYAVSISDSAYLSRDKSRGDGGVLIPKSPFAGLIGNPIIIDSFGRRDIKDYRLDTSGREAKIHFPSAQVLVQSDQTQIEINFAAGYGGEGEPIPEVLRQAMLMVIAQLYENRCGSANDQVGLPLTLHENVTSMLRPFQNLRIA